MESKSKVIIFVDGATQPLGAFEIAVNFVLDTCKHTEKEIKTIF